MKFILSIFLLVTIIVSIVTCGGGGISDEFSKEIDAFTTAWNNSCSTFNAVEDSVKTAKAKWSENDEKLVIPDSVKNTLSNQKRHSLDSISGVCKSHGFAYEELITTMVNYKLTLNNESKEIEEWQKKVKKGEIDIETAKKDLAEMKKKVEANTLKTNEINNRIAEINIACLGNSNAFFELLNKPEVVEEK